MDTEQGRALLQRRLALLSMVAFLISFAFYLVSVSLTVAVAGFTVTDSLLLPAHLVHAAGWASSLAVWLICRYGSLSVASLQVVDVGFVLLTLALYSVNTSLAAMVDPSGPEYTMTLTAMTLLTARSIVVPSSPRRTLMLALFGTLAVIATLTAAITHADQTTKPLAPAVVITYVVLWCGAMTAISTLASRVIYGLRKQVMQARRLGQYVLDERIGAGGMGVVYRARHAMLRRPTAVKVLPPDRAGTLNLSRFEREVQLTSELTHPNTVAIYDYGHTPDGLFYYAMEYLDGLDLERLVGQHGPQSPERVVHILVQVCGALSEAHGVGLVHRDLKPANIILCERGGTPDVAKLLDFGLVKRMESDDPTLSNVQSLVGTPMLIAPEALTSPDDVDARSDIYALGGVMYYLLTGSYVFSGTLVEVCSKHLHEPPEPPSARLGSALPAQLEELVLSCLHKDPNGRPQSADALAAALQECRIPRWTRQDALTWWKHAQVQNRGKPVVEQASSMSLLTIDVRQRVASD